MHWIDWMIVVIPVLFVVGIAIFSKRYVRGVVDYLAAGRVAGRYVLTVGDMTSGLGIITLVAMIEQAYRTGFAVGYWGVLATPILIIVSLTGFCIYRFRESKALSNGQFLEMRYSRSFRIVASFLRILSEMLTNAIGPAVAVNFFIYYLGLPHEIMLFGFAIPTFSLLVGLVLCAAMLIILPAGRISLLITDSIQGLICYPVFVIIAVFIIIKFSWGSEIVPVMADRVQGESFLNPFDINKLRDFNIFYIVVMIISNIYNRGSWLGNDTSSAGRTPHEQKMASVLATWRMGLGATMCLLVALTVLTVMNHKNFSSQAHSIRQDLAKKVAAEVITSEETLAAVNDKLEKVPVLIHQIGKDKPLSHEENLDMVYEEAAHEIIGSTAEGNYVFQKFRSLYYQMMMPMSLRTILPACLLGVFCLIAILLMITTDDSRIFNASTAIMQDLVLPFKKKRLTPRQHLKYIKVLTLVVALFFFAGSLFFAQLDYINMFLAIMVAIWMGAAGPIMVFGLYSRFGNTVGAYCALIFGSGTSITGVLVGRNWAKYVYPFLVEHGWAQGVGKFLETVTKPFNPYIVWKMNAVKCPINSYEFFFLAMLFGTVAYVAGSLLAYRKPFNLDRLLHRGKYNTDGVAEIKSPWTLKNVWSKLIGITPDYTRGDKIIVWSIFFYTFGYQVGLCFVAVVTWNMLYSWPLEWWSHYYFINHLVVGPVIGAITTVWFFCGGVRDIKRLFKDLARRVDNPLDNGRVEGHVAVSDIKLLGKNED